MSSTNFFAEPLVFSAMPSETSLADSSITAISACRTVNSSPVSAYMLELPGSIPYAAASDMTSLSFIFRFSQARSVVIIFVILAGYCWVSAFLEYRTDSVTTSIRTADSASILGPSGQPLMESVSAAWL